MNKKDKKLKIIRKKDSKGNIKYFIAHRRIKAVIGELFDNIYSAEKRLKELNEEDLKW